MQNIDKFARLLDLHGSSLKNEIRVDGYVYNQLSEENRSVAAYGYEFVVKPKISVVKALSLIPEYVYFDTGTFQLIIFSDGEEDTRICYQATSFEEDSKYKKDWDEYGCWNNPLEDGHTCDFLYLQEGIRNDEELVQGLMEVKLFLEENKLL